MFNNNGDGNDCLEPQMDDFSYTSPQASDPILTATDYIMGQLKPSTVSDNSVTRDEMFDTCTFYVYV